MFMDALAASAHNKKEPKKRKRRISVTKDATTPTTPTSPPTSPTLNSLGSPLHSPTAFKAIAPKFYKDTLDTDEKTSEGEETKTEADKDEAVDETGESDEKKVKVEDDHKKESTVKDADGLRGVLVHHKKRGPKKSVSWRNDSELEEIQYFELDETERVNVTKTFTDMKQMEHVGEREALQMSRKLPHEDTMDERTSWKPLVPIDLPPPLAEPGTKSTEKAVQYAREKNILQAIYFNKSMLPDSGAEPDVEHHNVTDPVIIPLIDVTGNTDSIYDYQNTPWPEPKGSPPHNVQQNVPNVQPNIFPGGMPQFNNNIAAPNFSGPVPGPFTGPGFGPNMMGGDWRMGDGPVMQQDVINHGPMNPNMYNNRPDNYNNMMDEGGFGPNNFGPGPGPGPGPGMGPGPGPMYQNFGNRGNRGGFRNMNRGGWFRPSGPPPGWHGGPRGGQGWGGRGGGAGICKQFKMHGYCRNRDSCPYMHPQGNGPY